MEVKFKSSFRRDYRALRNPALRERINNAVDDVVNAPTSRNLTNIKHLKGHPTAYSIRVGDYRIGLHIDTGKAIFTSIGHRSDIYHRFP